MRLEGSCQCGAVRFAVESSTPHPYMRCYCSICRKSAGGGGYAINLGAHNETLEVEGKEHLTFYHADRDGSPSQAQRHYCGQCGSHLWLWDPRWPELVHPQAGAIDTPLPVPPQIVHIMLESKPDWVVADIRPGDLSFDGYPEESIEAWHRRHGLYED
jgi:hypothetical protein